MASTETSFGLAVGGIGFQVALPNAQWRSALAPLYSEFPLENAPDWQVTVSYEPDLAAAMQRWIEHDGPLTRFYIDSYAGWVDLERQQALIRTDALAHGASAVERAVAYACMHALPRQRASLLLHAAGIQWRGQGLVVSGHSGAGKTTFARLALGYGEPFNDEMVIVDLSTDQPLLLSTPFLGLGTPPEMQRRIRRSTPATALLFLAHGTSFELTPLSPADAVLELLRTNIAAVERVSSAEIWMALVADMLQALPVFRLHFRPAPELWEYLTSAWFARDLSSSTRRGRMNMNAVGESQ